MVKKNIAKEKYDEFDAKVNTDESNQHLIKKKKSVGREKKAPIVQVEQPEVIK